MLKNTGDKYQDPDDGDDILIAVPAFTEEQWQVVLDHWEDSLEKMSHSTQRAVQAKMVKELKLDGKKVQEIGIDPHKMLSWMKKNKHRNDSHGRATYYAEVARCRGEGAPDPE